jgi:hypothetical protein
MNEYEAETLVRDAFRGREHLVEGCHEGLGPAVIARVARRRRVRRVVGAAAAVVTVLVGTAAAVAMANGGDRGDRATVTTDGDGTGWRWESSLGAEILVPSGWGLDDLGCLASDRPSVVRYPRPEFMCYGAEPVTKEVAILSPRSSVPADAVGLTTDSVTVDGVPATRGEWRTPDGRYGGLVDVPSRYVAVEVRTLDVARTRRILDSVRLVDVDHVGCPARRPVRVPSGVLDEPLAGPFVSAEPTAIGVCVYHSGFGSEPVEGRLRSSRTATGDDAIQLAAGINAAAPGLNPDPPASECNDDGPPVFDVMLLVRTTDAVETVWVTFSSCTARGLDNGVRQAQLTMPLLWEIMRGVGGFTMPAALPGG